MSGTAAIQLRTLAGELCPPGRDGTPPQFAVDRLAVRLYQAGVDRALPELSKRIAHAQFDQVQLRGDEIVVAGAGTFLVTVRFEAKLAISVTAEGFLRVEITSLRALGLPLSLFTDWILDKAGVKGMPGIARVDGTRVDVDFTALLRHLRIESLRLPPLQAVLQDDGWLELAFRAQAEAPV